MVGAAAIFIAICMVLIAASAGAVLFFYFGFSGFEATLVGLGALSALALYNAVVTRLRDRSDLGEEIASLSRDTADLARQVDEVISKMSGIESRAEQAVARARSAVSPLSNEIGELGLLITQLAESVAHHETVLAAEPSLPQAQERVAAAPQAAPPKVAPQPLPRGVSPLPPAVGEANPFRGQSEAAIAAVIREAIEANCIDLYLQPIVTLPQRKVRYYEAAARLRLADGRVIAAADFMPFAERSRLIAEIDHMMLLRCVQVLRRLLMKNREVGLFCNISAVTLADPDFPAQFTDFMDANRTLAPSLMLEFKQATLRGAGSVEQQNLAALIQRGFRFSMDHVRDLHMEPKELIARGVRFVKVGADLLLDRHAAAASAIHLADLPNLYNRFGIDLIAERVENETSVADLLDFDVRFGQGFLFSPPRAVRAEAMAVATPETADAPSPMVTSMAGSKVADSARPPAFRAIA